MYFPENMTFQYFFFSTYIGYFLQALPIALAAGAIYALVRFRGDSRTSAVRKMFSCVFVCYMTGLICLVIGLDVMNDFWYRLIYHRDSGSKIRLFSGVFDFVPDFFGNISDEVIGNLLLFLPFGVLYPLTQAEPKWGRTVAAGILTVAVIEVLQPVFGRAFDINDVILNSLGVVASASAFTGVKKLTKKSRGRDKK